MFTSFILYKKFSKGNSNRKLNIIRNYSIIFLIINLLCNLIILDKAKTESNNSPSKNLSKLKKISTDYLQSREELKDYIIDTGDILLINFESEPRKISEFKNSRNSKEEISYLKQRTNLNQYILDSRDIIFIDFIWAPEFSNAYTIDKEGEIRIPEIGKVYVRGLTLKELKKLLEISYEEYLVNPELDLSIKNYKSIRSGNYDVNLEGEIILPEIKDTYVRGLTIQELENLLEKKYLQEFFIPLDISIRISRYKKLRILISGEVRNPGIFKFSGYNSINISRNINNSEIKNNVKEIEFSNQKDLVKDLSTGINELGNNSFGKENLVSVKNPNDEYTTISKAIRRAGGITSKSDLSKIKLLRDIPISQGGGLKKKIIDLTSFLNLSNPKNDLRLFDGDRIEIPSLKRSNPKQIPQSVLSGLSPKFVSVAIFGRIETPGYVDLPIESTLSDLIDIAGPIKPLSGDVKIIRYDKDGSITSKKINFSRNSKRGSKKNPYLKGGDYVTIQNTALGKSTNVITELTAPFLGIYTTKEVIEGLAD